MILVHQLFGWGILQLILNLKIHVHPIFLSTYLCYCFLVFKYIQSTYIFLLIFTLIVHCYFTCSRKNGYVERCFSFSLLGFVTQPTRSPLSAIATTVSSKSVHIEGNTLPLQRWIFFILLATLYFLMHYGWFFSRLASKGGSSSLYCSPWCFSRTDRWCSIWW
jgi:hypothetical protein